MRSIFVIVFVLFSSSAVNVSGADAPMRPHVVTIAPHGTLLIDGKGVFPIGFTMPPPPDGVTPEGKGALAELAEAGATFLRTGPMAEDWNDGVMAREQKYLDGAAKYGLLCATNLREFASLRPSDPKEAKFREIVNRFKDHPGLGVWKGVDEPEWGKKPVEPMKRVYGLLKEMDPNHPVFVVQAPRGTVEALRAYEPTYDITGADIYPISYPPGTHSNEANKEMSMVGDFTQKMMKVAGGEKPVWMVLQITFSGTIKPGKQLRMPTFPETRFMTYQAIINGARGVKYFGGHIQKSMPPEDAKLGWHWGHWKKVLRPVIEEIGSQSALYPALLAPESGLGVKCATPGVEFCVREVGKDVFVLACRREGETVAAKFTGLPDDVSEGEVMYEAPRKVEVKGGVLSDWFGPFEVHVYRFGRN